MQHLLSIDDLGRDGIDELLRLTDTFAEVNRRPIPKVPALRGKTVVSLFYEDSTRTRLSFETAAKRLSADTMTFSVATSSVKKGESVRDTVETIEAMGVDAIVVRHRSAGVPWNIRRWTSSAIINGGDGWHEHPTQALLDAYTVREHLGQVDGLRVAMVGDIKHSRVARSTTLALAALGAEVVWVAPPTLLPPRTDWFPVTVSHDLDAALPGADVVYLLRMQLERQDEALIPSLREYTSRYGLTGRRAELLGDRTLVMHPGPMNRGVEISAEVASGGRAVITDQVRNGVSVRMAVLYRLLAGPGADAPVDVPDDTISEPGGDRSPTTTTREVRTPPMADMVLKGGRIIDETGERSGDVVVGDDGTILAVGPDLSADRVLDAVRLRHRAGPRRPPHPPAPAGTRGGRDGRDGLAGCGARRLHGRGGHAQHRAGDRQRLGGARGAGAGSGLALPRRRRRCHHRRAQGRAARPARRDGRARCPALHRRRLGGAGRSPHAAGPRVRRSPGRAPRPALRGRIALARAGT